MLLYPYKMGSKSARDLAGELEILRITPTSTFRRAGVQRTVLNWGNANIPTWDGPRITWINNPRAVNIAGNKLLSFSAFKEAQLSIPEFTTDYQEALRWAPRKTVVARSALRASGGIGIRIYEPGEAIPEPQVHRDQLYVEYIPKVEEYRVHVYNGRVIDTQIKRKRNDTERDTTKIRNLANGYVFCRNNIRADDRRDQLAVAAVSSLGLNFGAVDLIFNRRRDAYFLLEVNSAPGLEGTTLDNYVRAIKGA